jgi:3-deoxy-D-manno-octulosonic-acid transferase
VRHPGWPLPLLLLVPRHPQRFDAVAALGPVSPKPLRRTQAKPCACPIVMGPHTFNFAQAASLAEEAGAAKRAPDLDAALALALDWLQDAPAHRQACAAASAFARQHRGAAARMAEAILALMPERELEA